MDKQLTILLPNDVPLELILVEPGYFIMGSVAEGASGSEGPEHIVHISQAFYISKYLVTQAQWDTVMENRPSNFVGMLRPVEYVSWEDIVKGDQDDDGALAFIDRINDLTSSKRLKLFTNYQFRLPTEAEWEYAAKGGPRFDLDVLNEQNKDRLYSTYAGSDYLESCGWFENNSKLEPKPVGCKNANELGLYDMSGNVLEWCIDWYSKDIYQSRKGSSIPEDPVNLVPGTHRVLRGGAYWNNEGTCRSTFRGLHHPKNRANSIGFRLVLSPI